MRKEKLFGSHSIVWFFMVLVSIILITGVIGCKSPSDNPKIEPRKVEVLSASVDFSRLSGFDATKTHDARLNLVARFASQRKYAVVTVKPNKFDQAKYIRVSIYGLKSLNFMKKKKFHYELTSFKDGEIVAFTRKRSPTGALDDQNNQTLNVSDFLCPTCVVSVKITE